MDFTSNSSRRRRRTSSVLLLETSLSHIFNRKNKQFRTIPPRTTRLLSWNAGGVTYAASAGWATKRPASLVTHLDGSPISNVKSLSVGFYHACAVVESGEMYCWGSNRWGQIGDDGGGGVGALAVSPTAVPRPGGTPVSTHKSVHCGQYHTCAVLNDDTVWCWGFNGDGQLGVSNTANTNALTVPVANLEDVQSQSLSVGIAHACALLKNATLRCWGENSHGSLGVGDITDRLIPVTVAGIGDARSVRCGLMYTCAVGARDDSFWCWGRNSQYQLGLDGLSTNRWVPTEVSGITMLPRKCTCCETKMKARGYVVDRCVSSCGA